MWLAATILDSVDIEFPSLHKVLLGWREQHMQMLRSLRVCGSFRSWWPIVGAVSKGRWMEVSGDDTRDFSWSWLAKGILKN